MKKILGILSMFFIVSGLLLVSCSKQDTEPKTEQAAEEGIYSEKAGEMMETAEETISGYAEEAGEAMESAGEKVKETAAEYTEEAKERVYGYTEPEEEAKTGEDKTGEMSE